MKARVLIADDASFMRQMIREIIEPDGFEVVGEATDGIEAAELYEQLRPDIVTMDIVMPKQSGIDAVKGILAQAPDAKVVMMGRSLPTRCAAPAIEMPPSLTAKTASPPSENNR